MLKEIPSLITSTQNATTGYSFSVIATAILGLFLLSACAIYLYQQITHKKDPITLGAWLHFFKQIALKPCVLILGTYFCYLGLFGLYLFIPKVFLGLDTEIFMGIAYLLRFIEIAAFFWFVFNTLNIGQTKLYDWLIIKEYKIASILLPTISKSLQAAIVVLMVNMIIPELGLAGLAAEILEKSAQVLLIVVLGWIFVQVVDALSQVILSQYKFGDANSTAARKVNTQVLLLKRIILAIGFIVIIASTLMVFDSVKKLGAGLLTTAGIISAVGAFASQQSLSRIFAGLQIAFTQPIRIGDTVIIENEFGQIEEITLSYIVVKLWDLRRLILPTDYLTNKGLQNLTRSSSDLLGTAFFYVDYTFPVEKLREKFKELLASSDLWDGKVCALQVTDITDGAMQIRALMSAANASILFDLRCITREKMMQYIIDNHADALPKVRNFTSVNQKNEAGHKSGTV